MSRYTDNEKFALLKKFHDMDSNDDGVLTVEEIKKCCELSRLPASKVKDFLGMFDGDGDSKITLDEYERALGIKVVPKASIDEWKRTFEEMDKDNSGELTIDELYEGLQKVGMKMTKEDVRGIVESVDEDGSKSLSVKEFTTLMRL